MILLLLLSTIASPNYSQEYGAIRCYVEASGPTNDSGYASQAKTLADYMLSHQNTKLDQTVVESMLRNIDKYVARFFPSGPFTRNDFIAIAWLESDFNQMENGSHGERGLFQIMPDEFAGYGVTRYFYGVQTNTLMAFRVLRDKYARWNDYKKAIIAYNGVVRCKNGSWSEHYWDAFRWRKAAIDKLLPTVEEA